MFTPTNYNPYFFPSSSSFSNPFFLTNPEPNSSANTSFHLHDPHALSFLNAPITPDVTLSNLGAVSDFAPVCAKQDISIIPPHYAGYHHHSSNLAAGNFLKKPPSSAAKKDRHSKIHTSQGLRDRRVRLSIEIARKFFDLQDMLGFDKASNTLDWLFSKSKKAIRELELTAQCKNTTTAATTTTTTTTNANTRASLSSDEDNGRKRKEKEKKESREKARARARERTSHKGKSLVENANTSNNNNDIDNNYNNYEGGREEFKVIEESIVIKRKLKQQQQQSNLVASHPQNQLVDVIPNKELPTFSNTNTNNATNHHDDDDDHSSIFPNLSPNWDSNARSNFCAIASMNLSTELQIFGKSTWEECNNHQRLH